MSTPPKPPRPAYAPKLFEQPAQTHTITEKRPTTVEGPPAYDPERRVVSAIPGVTDSKMFFELFIFHPDESIPKAALIEVLKAAKLTFAPNIFEQLTPEAQRHFLRLDRTGSLHPYRPSRNRGQ